MPYVYRSAKTGKFVTKAFAARFPNETERERVDVLTALVAGVAARKHLVVLREGRGA